jgi:HD-GYP domain-containing protein (c-di-GMP phosphodiesterase class II)
LEPIIEALASQAAVALDNQLLLDRQRKLLESFIQVIASAIDAKSPYTGGHCQRVPVIAELLAQAACDSTSGPFRDFSLSEEELYELYIASWLHDCGKVTTPEYVVDKATKLETIYDRIETVKTRLEVLKRDAEIVYLKAVTLPGADIPALRDELEARLAELDGHGAFLESANLGGEFMADGMIERVQEIAALGWRDASGREQPFLSENEVYNLCIRRGTLTDEEREVINNHIVMTIEMLEQLPFPKTLVRVPEFAGGHHEKLDGTGYPQGLTGEQMSAPARMMAIADIFEALTAADRPYKQAKTLTESLRIMSFMVKDEHIDGELFRLFLEGGVYQRYAEDHLMPEQIDEVDIADYLA